VGGVTSLLDWGANPNTPSATSPLVSAVVAGYSDVVEILLNHGALPNTYTFTGGETPLYLTLTTHKNYLLNNISCGFLNEHEERDKIMEMLLKAGATPDCHNADGVSPLEVAVKLDDMDAAMLLLKYGANANAPLSPKEAKRRALQLADIPTPTLELATTPKSTATLMDIATPHMADLLRTNNYFKENTCNSPPPVLTKEKSVLVLSSMQFTSERKAKKKKEKNKKEKKKGGSRPSHHTSFWKRVKMRLKIKSVT